MKVKEVVYDEKEHEFRKNAGFATYENKEEENFRTGDAREAWGGLNQLSPNFQCLEYMIRSR